MASVLRLTGTLLFIASVGIGRGAGTVLAHSDDADPIPGFGVLIAVVALFVALFIARRKQSQYREQSP